MTGTTIGENTELLALWTPGSCNVSYPEDVGGQLPANGKILVQWHHSNETGGVQPDGSKMTICTVPEGSRPHVGGITVLGTEILGGPIGMSAGKHEFSGSCVNVLSTRRAEQRRAQLDRHDQHLLVIRQTGAR